MGAARCSRTEHALACLAGCSAPGDKQIGEGPASLVFENEGYDRIEVRVRWTDDSGTDQSRRFSVHAGQEVELLLDDRSEYRVTMDADCSSLSTFVAPATPVDDAGDQEGGGT